MSWIDRIEKKLDNPLPEDDIQQKLDAIPFVKKYKKIMVISTLTIFAAFLSLLLFFVFCKQVKPPSIMLATLSSGPSGEEKWNTEQIYPMIYPNQSKEAVAAWAEEVVQKVYTFDFLHQQEQTEAVKSYFTQDAWHVFKTVLENGELLATVTKNKLSVSITPIEPAIMEDSAAKGGIDFAWKVLCPVLISFSGDTPTQSKEMVIALTIIRVPTTENPRGLGVLQINALPARKK